MKQAFPGCLALLVALTAGGQAESIRGAPTGSIYRYYSGTDDLGRRLALPGEAGVPAHSRSKSVGIFYFIWHNRTPEAGPYDNSKIIAADPRAAESNERWLAAGGGEAGLNFHWWGEPLLGYFRADDPWVVERDVQMLTDAGMDFLIVDSSNPPALLAEACLLLDTLRKFAAQGFTVPKVAFVTKANSGKKMMALYRDLYLAHPEYDALWYRLDGKPLIIGNVWARELTPAFRDYFTLRYAQWPREQPFRENGFPWMAFERPQHLYGKTLGHSVISVSVAQHSGTLAFSSSAFYGDTTNKTRSYHDGGNDPAPDAYLYGYNFAEQFEHALSVDPDIVFVTGWNEWIAYRMRKWYDLADPVIFVDNADANNSRDIQPMHGGYGDNYLMQLMGYARRFKGVRETGPGSTSPPGREMATIDVKGGFAQWDGAGALYVDYTDEIGDREHKGSGRMFYENRTGRNDIKAMRMVNDRKCLYVYVETVAPLTDPGGSHWMGLFLHVNGQGPNWYGYDYVMNRTSPDASSLVLEKCLGGWSWRPVARIPYRMQGNKLHAAIPLAALGMAEGEPVQLEFKWADNYQGEGDFWSFYTDGDAAPYGRLNFTYRVVQETAKP